MKFILYRDESREYRWRLVAGNGNIVADSGEGYKNKSDCVATVESIKKAINEAPIEEESGESS